MLVADFDGDAANVWKDATTGADLRRALTARPGFGAEKAAIFTAVLAKQRGVRPPGWQEAAGAYGEDGSFRLVADVVDEESLAKVRETKRSVKAARKVAAAG